MVIKGNSTDGHVLMQDTLEECGCGPSTNITNILHTGPVRTSPCIDTLLGVYAL